TDRKLRPGSFAGHLEPSAVMHDVAGRRGLSPGRDLLYTSYKTRDRQPAGPEHPSPSRRQGAMKPPQFEHASPTTLADAVSALAASDGDGKVLAGGQSLVPLLNFRLAAPRLLVDLNRVSELSHFSIDGDAVRIGAMTRMRTLETDPDVARRFP